MTTQVEAVVPDVCPLHVSAKGTVLLDRQATDLRHQPGQPQPGMPSVVIETCQSWFLTANGSLVHSQGALRSGYTKRRKGRESKHWQRWQLHSMRTLRRTRYGYWLLTERTKFGGRDTRKVTELREFELYFPTRIRVIAGWGEEGPADLASVYPFIDHYTKSSPFAVNRWGDPRGNDTWHNLIRHAGPEFSRRLAGARTARDIAVTLFGKTRVTKALVKAIGNPDLLYSRLELAWTLRGHVPTDWLVDYLRTDDAPPPGMSHLRPAVRVLPRTVLRRLLKAGGRTLHSHKLKDLTRMVQAGNHTRTPAQLLARVRTWTDLHDAITKGVVTTSDRWSVPTDLHPAAGPVGDLTLEFLRNHTSLVEAGTALSNCIGSYQQAAKSGSSVLAVLNDADSKPVAAIELGRLRCGKGEPKQWQLNQLLGRFNRPLSKVLHDQVVDHLAAAGGGHIVIGDDYWGRL